MAADDSYYDIFEGVISDYQEYDEDEAYQSQKDMELENE